MRFSSDNGPSESYRWELVENFRKRSDESANILRATLLAITTASFGFVLNKNYQDLPNSHIASLILFGGALVFIVWSWNRQKDKSIERLKALRDFGYEMYLEKEREFTDNRTNSRLDLIAQLLVGLGFLAEVAILSWPGFKASIC